LREGATMNCVVYDQEVTLFKLPHTKFQPTLEVSMAAVVVKMEKNKFRAVIKHFYLKKWTAAQIKAELNEVRGFYISVEDRLFVD